MYVAGWCFHDWGIISIINCNSKLREHWGYKTVGECGSCFLSLELSKLLLKLNTVSNPLKFTCTMLSSVNGASDKKGWKPRLYLKRFGITKLSGPRLFSKMNSRPSTLIFPWLMKVLTYNRRTALTPVVWFRVETDSGAQSLRDQAE